MQIQLFMNVLCLNNTLLIFNYADICKIKSVRLENAVSHAQ